MPVNIEWCDTADISNIVLPAATIQEVGCLYVGAMPLPAYMTMTGKLQFYQEQPGPMESCGQAMNPASIRLPQWKRAADVVYELVKD